MGWDSRMTSKKNLFQEGVFILIVLFFLFHCYLYWSYTVDDSYIGYRYATNLVRGQGLVFNSGERVEGFSNFLWILILAVLVKLGMNPIISSKILGIILSVFTIFIVKSYSKKWLQANSCWHNVAPLFLAANAGFACWAVAGMETPLYLLLLTLGTLSLILAIKNRKTPYLSITCFLLASFTRPEGIMFIIIAGFYLIAINLKDFKFIKKLIFRIIPFFLIYGFFLVFRYFYYGDLFPNTYYAKVNHSLRQLYSGFDYIYGFILKNGGVALYVLPLLLLSRRHLQKHYILLFFIIGAACFFIVYSGGDWMPSYRFLVPVMPIIFILIQESLRKLYYAVSKYNERINEKIAQVFIGIFMLVVLFFMTGHSLFLFRKVGQLSQGYRQAHYKLGQILAIEAPRGASIAVGDIGMVGYYSHLIVIDLSFGLTDRFVAETLHRRIPEVEKYSIIGKYILEQKPDYIVLVSIRDFEKEGFVARWRLEGYIYSLPRFYNQYFYHSQYLFKKRQLTADDRDYCLVLFHRKAKN
jgi:arabinofuranosyltransferase